MNHLALEGETMSMLVEIFIYSTLLKCHLKVKSINRRNCLMPGIIFVFSMNGLTYSFLIRGGWLCVETMTFSLSGCCIYLPKAAFTQHHEEVEVMNAHFDFARAWRVDRWTGRDRGRGQDRRKWFRQRGRHCLRQSGCCSIWLRLLESHSGRVERWQVGWCPAHTHTHTDP